jgi:TetR/AcrR family transcriptional repressor of nem operon
LNETFGKKLDKAFDAMQQTIMELLRSARIKKQIPDSLDNAETAAFILTSWEGALMRMKVTRNELPYTIFQKMVFTRLLT